MPKRITLTKQQDIKNFRSGFSCGVSAAVLAMQMKQLRVNRKVTLEEVSLETKIPMKLLEGIESANDHIYLSLDTEQLFTLAKYFDVTIDVSFKSSTAVLNSVLDSIQVKTFQEEFGGIEP